MERKIYTNNCEEERDSLPTFYGKTFIAGAYLFLAARILGELAQNSVVAESSDYMFKAALTFGGFFMTLQNGAEWITTKGLIMLANNDNTKEVPYKVENPYL